MSRQLAEIQESHARLTELHRLETRSGARNRLRMLMLLHDNPERAIADVARELECSERNVLRWWQKYQAGGLDALLEQRHKGRPSQMAAVDIDEIRAKIAESDMTGLDEIRTWLSEEHGLQYSRSGVWYALREILRARHNTSWLLLEDDESAANAAGTPDSLTLDNPTAVIGLLNSLPMTDDVVEWGNGFRTVLHRLLPDVDRISVNVNRSCDIRRPEKYELQTRITRLSEEGETDLSVATHRTNEAPSLRIIENLRAKGMPLHTYHPPVVRDYFFGGTAYLGSLFLWRNLEMPEISAETTLLLTTLEPFFLFALSDVVARHQVMQPVDSVFHEALSTMFEDAGLTPAERRIVTLQLLGKPYKEIADTMAVTLDAVKKHFHLIYKKTETRSQAELFAKYFTARLKTEQSKLEQETP